ncbi:hypothetical protein EDC01DRAFT_7940 [Geopyxis carbonaria]|nr:hypothetical protein EDC01DRAFT_7940 [Geopyxis carbonaria]
MEPRWDAPRRDAMGWAMAMGDGGIAGGCGSGRGRGSSTCPASSSRLATRSPWCFETRSGCGNGEGVGMRECVEGSVEGREQPGAAGSAGRPRDVSALHRDRRSAAAISLAKCVRVCRVPVRCVGGDLWLLVWVRRVCVWVRGWALPVSVISATTPPTPPAPHHSTAAPRPSLVAVHPGPRAPSSGWLWHDDMPQQQVPRHPDNWQQQQQRLI